MTNVPKKAKPKVTPRWSKVDDLPTTPEAVLSKIADIMEIPDAKRPGFVLGIKRVIQICGDTFIDEQLKKQSVRNDRRALEDIVDMAKRLHDAIKETTPSVRRHIGGALAIAAWRTRCKERGYEFSKPEGERGEEFVVEVLAKFLEPSSAVDTFLKSCAKAAKVTAEVMSVALRDVGLKPKHARRGNVKGRANRTAFLLAIGLIRITREFGGKCTAYHATDTGTLVDAQKLCLSLLPEGFKLYSSSSLEKIIEEEPRLPSWRGWFPYPPGQTNKSK